MPTAPRPSFISAYSRKADMVHRFYTTVNVMRTIEDLIGLDHLSMFDAMPSL
jgi:hypothetical protein